MAIGEAFVQKKSSSDKKVQAEKFVNYRVHEVIKNHASLYEFSESFPWFKALMSTILESRVRPVQSLKTTKINLSSLDAKQIGSGFSVCMLSCLTPQLAIDEWISNYVSLVETDHDHIWFRPMMNIICQRLLGASVVVGKLNVVFIF